jgi:hypothetical protein
MEEKRKPVHDLAAIRAAIASGDSDRFRFDTRVTEEQIPATKLPMEDVLAILCSLDEEHFWRSEEGEHADYLGKWYDTYFVPKTGKKGYLVKVDVEADGFVRVFSFHSSKTPKELKDA